MLPYKLSKAKREILHTIGYWGGNPGFSERQIARALGCSRSTVRYWISKAYQQHALERWTEFCEAEGVDITRYPTSESYFHEVPDED